MLIAITREVSSSIADCELSRIERQPIDLNTARRQHTAYEETLEAFRCLVHHLHEEPDLPDSVFIEDTAVVLDELAVITRPGAESRRAETESAAEALKPFRELYFIEPPALLDGGDVLVTGKNVYVGLSSRTNPEAAAQLREKLKPLGYEVKEVMVAGCLHLKSAVTRVLPETLLVNPQWVDPGVFKGMRIIEVAPQEPMAANALMLPDTVIYTGGFPRTAEKLEAEGACLTPVDLSELRKAEGGVTCCSLVFGR